MGLLGSAIVVHNRTNSAPFQNNCMVPAHRQNQYFLSEPQDCPYILYSKFCNTLFLLPPGANARTTSALCASGRFADL